jgi:hypothetical protein
MALMLISRRCIDMAAQHYKTAKRVSLYEYAGPCADCGYRDHCAGRRDAVTGVSTTSFDTCDQYDKYDPWRGRVNFDADRTPHRVAGARRLHLISAQEVH